MSEVLPAIVDVQCICSVVSMSNVVIPLIASIFIYRFQSRLPKEARDPVFSFLLISFIVFTIAEGFDTYHNLVTTSTPGYLIYVPFIGSAVKFLHIGAYVLLFISLFKLMKEVTG